MRAITLQDALRFAFSPDGSDTTQGLSDAELAIALRIGNLLEVAEMLSEAHGRIIAREDIARRVEASPKLQGIYRQAAATYMERSLDEGMRQAIEKRVMRLLKRERRRGPPCGAKCRDGHPCRRKPVPGRTRCPSHCGRTPSARRTGLAVQLGR